MDLRGKKVIVTGGVRGLGLCTVEALIAREALVTVFDINAQGLDELRTRYATVHCVKCDIADYEQVKTAVGQYHAEFGAPHVLVNNAGILYSAPLVKISMAGIEKHDVGMWNKVLSTNLSSVFYMTACVAEKMIASRTKGVIVNISSISASGNMGQSAYSAAKAGVNALTATWAKELGAMGIRVVAVAPGFTETESTKEALSEAVLLETIKKVPLRRLGKPQEIAQGVICVIENDFFNGKVFELDGGLVILTHIENLIMYEYNLPIRFQAVCEKYPQRTALWFDKNNIVKYAELNKLANRLARLLLEQGIGAGDVVCISGMKTLYTYAFMLACLKIGAAYSILDPDSPVERLRKILSTCEPKLLAAGHDLCRNMAPVLDELSIIPVELDSEKFTVVIAKYDDTDLPVTQSITGINPSYIMYTSGSTGLPKGAVMTHANVLNLIEWGRETYAITPEDIMTNVNPLYFDNSVFDFYCAIFNGACLVPFSKEETRDPKQLVDKVDAAACSLWFSVPSMLIFLQTMKATDGKYLRTIRRFIFGGEGYPKAKLKKLFDAYSDTSEFFNVSGPTECTCICSSYRLTDDDFQDLEGFPALGSIARNFSFLILDEDGREVKDGELGELCLLGPNVGRGYYNDPERTALGFVQNPHNRATREIMYKTGDLVRLDPADGKLYIHGRKDNQIKHMGYRIELEEIENALHRVEYISEAVTIHSNSGGLSRIIAAVSTHQQVDDERLRQDLRKLIPDYMIPSAFYYEETLPKNPNGKVDRKRIKEIYLALDEERRTK